MGERLALITLLQESYGIHPAAGETIEQLQARYATAWRATRTPEQRADAERTERMLRLRRQLSERFSQAADASLDEDGLITLLHQLQSEALNRPLPADPADGPAPAAGTTTRERRPAAHAPAAPVAVQTDPPAARIGPAAATIAKPIPFAAEGVATCRYWNDGPHALLLVTFGEDKQGAFTGIPEHTWSIISHAKTPHRVVALLGHGNGSGIARKSIEDHLRANRDFYESVGGQLPARKVECLLFGSCSAFNPDQMAIMRDGLGYYPTWKVAAGSRDLMNAPVFFAALTTIIDLPSSTPFRGFFRFTPSKEPVSSVGEVGIEGERADVSKWTVEMTATGLGITRMP